MYTQSKRYRVTPHTNWSDTFDDPSWKTKGKGRTTAFVQNNMELPRPNGFLSKCTATTPFYRAWIVWLDADSIIYFSIRSSLACCVWALIKGRYCTVLSWGRHNVLSCTVLSKEIMIAVQLSFHANPLILNLCCHIE